MPGAVWTAEQTAQLRDLWCGQGQPINAIQKLTGRTDWAIRGKIRYEGWPTPLGVRERQLNHQSRLRVNRIRQVGPTHHLPANKKLLRGSAWRALEGEPVALVDLDAGMCKWPIGNDSPYLFCGLAAEGTYCPTHAALSRAGK